MKTGHLFIAICLLLLPIFSSAQSKQGKVKVAYLYKFIENLEWKNQSQLPNFKIAYWGSEKEVLAVLKRLEAIKKIKGKKIKVIDLNSISEIKPPYPQVLLMGNDKNKLLEPIFNKLLGENTLIVSDGADLQQFVMINFIYPQNKKISFEVNKKTIIDQEITIIPKLLLLGGSEINVRELYKEKEAELNAEKKTSRRTEKKVGRTTSKYR